MNTINEGTLVTRRDQPINSSSKMQCIKLSQSFSYLLRRRGRGFEMSSKRRRQTGWRQAYLAARPINGDEKEKWQRRRRWRRLSSNQSVVVSSGQARPGSTARVFKKMTDCKLV